MSLLDLGIRAAESGLVPDRLMRAAIRRLCRMRLRELAEDERAGCDCGERGAFLESLRSGPIAPVPEKANEQHYELPPEFFAAVLGPHRKYSCCLFEDAGSTLAEAEAAALAVTCERAGLDDGQDVLELGCGWGSLSLWMAESYPRSRITAVSNSAAQRRFIESEAARLGLGNLRIVTADMNDFQPDGLAFERIVSVEMFEHMRNYDRLLERIASWLRPDGTLFVHIFCHRAQAYPFESEGSANWMGRHFFTGGTMPSVDLLHRFSRSLKVISQWNWNGRHYRRTADAWLENLDRRRAEILPILASTYGRPEAARWLQRWRLFFLAVSELFGYGEGDEWFVTHLLMGHAAASQSHASPAEAASPNAVRPNLV